MRPGERPTLFERGPTVFGVSARHSLPFQGQTNARDDLVPRALLASRVVDQHAVDEALREVASIVPDNIPLIARYCKEPRCHSFVLNVRWRISLREKGSRRLVAPSWYRLDCQFGPTICRFEPLSKPVRLSGASLNIDEGISTDVPVCGIKNVVQCSGCAATIAVEAAIARRG
jgi:hypothetical protein